MHFMEPLGHPKCSEHNENIWNTIIVDNVCKVRATPSSHRSILLALKMLSPGIYSMICIFRAEQMDVHILTKFPDESLLLFLNIWGCCCCYCCCLSFNFIIICRFFTNTINMLPKRSGKEWSWCDKGVTKVNPSNYWTRTPPRSWRALAFCSLLSSDT